MPQNNITYERYVFQNVQQNVDENIHQIYIRVKEQAVKYDFGATLDTEIKQQIILATNNNKLQRYCFRNQDVTLQQLLLHGKSLEDAESQAREIENMIENLAAVNLRRQRQPSQFTQLGEYTPKGGKSSHESGCKTCFQCGGNYPHSKDCPAKGKKCNKCQKEGHFERCCRSKIRPRDSNKPSNQVTTSPSFLGYNSDDSFDVFVFTTLFEDNEGSNQDNNINQGNSRYSVHPIPPLNLQVNNLDIFERKILVEGVMKINFLIDSGSAINIINLATFQNLKKVNSKLHLKTTKTKIVSYGQPENCLKIEGICYLTLETSSKLTTDKFYVVNTKAKNLLTGSCAIAVNLHSLNTKPSKSYQKQKHQSIKTSIKNINQKHQKHQVNVTII